MTSITPKHLATYGVETLDATTLRHLYSFASREVAAMDRIRAEIVEVNGERTAIDEWDSVFGKDRAAEVEAMEDVMAELVRRGLEL